MEEQVRDQSSSGGGVNSTGGSNNNNNNNTSSNQQQLKSGGERSEPVRSRWTPKPEQILILESIFNSGMVNPPKDETVRIRKLLERFGAVGDANVFYWFQNRRSRSRRRQRQIQAAQIQADRPDAILPRPPIPPSAVINILPSVSNSHLLSSSSSPYFPSSSSSAAIAHGASTTLIAGAGDENASDHHLFSIPPPQMGFSEIEQSPILPTSMMWPADTSNLHYQQPAGLITVFINGVPSEVPRGPLDMGAMFGQDVILVHSSGEPIPINDFGISLHGLQFGENYFLISRPRFPLPTSVILAVTGSLRDFFESHSVVLCNLS
ncbi:hypothetical protein H6P81_003028 [Aristolochia fimbriata]|uniref:Homeobox domain-containing protein n=1 Tax=Aristolochia fimbriata TaxID=158543 RepID=A0AAV7FBF9_ARIFI|nr:hypothetical protein H6P81_003028 [Aristolochia fimbriata]